MEGFTVKLELYTPQTPQVFYCSQCDRNTVDSQKPETGSFHRVFGHSFDQTKKEYSGQYTGVMFAICAECAKKDDWDEKVLKNSQKSYFPKQVLDSNLTPIERPTAAWLAPSVVGMNYTWSYHLG